MKIVLTEVRGDERLATHEFDLTTIKIGRDAALNDLVFDRTAWPMVSRRHAEIRFDKGDWYLADLGSANGTLLNGERIAEPTKLQADCLIRLGHDGPQLSVGFVGDSVVAGFQETLVDFEAAQQQAALLKRVQAHGPETKSQTKISNAEPIPSTARPLPKPPAPSEQLTSAFKTRADSSLSRPPALICESGSPNQIGCEYLLSGERLVLGRDPAADVAVDEATPAVSRRHAEIRRQNDGTFTIVDLSFNGTLVNDQRITGSISLQDGDRIQLALRGPVYRFVDPRPGAAIKSESVIAATAPSASAVPLDQKFGMHTIVSRSAGKASVATSRDHAQFVFERTFDGKPYLSVGRDAKNDIQLDGLLISKFHARFLSSPQQVSVQEIGSTNGVYVNGRRVTGVQPIQPQDVVQIGPFILSAVVGKGVAVFDTRSKTRIDAVGVTETVKGGSRKLLDDVKLAVQPNEFVGVLGPSGAGKSILLGALNGRRRPTSGRILINNLDLYKHIDSLKQWIGYVPQDDIIHRELTVYRTLYYVARLRLSCDVPTSEIHQIIGEVLDVTGLTDRQDVTVSQLSGGQRKRVSIAVELITKPSLIFLDEPTSGLDPATEQRMMKLFRQIAESGRTIILTTHAMENVRLFDRIALLMRGKLIFYGFPDEALEFFGAKSFTDLYNKLEVPIESEVAKLPQLPPKPTKTQIRVYERQREQIAEAMAEEWRSRFRSTDLYDRHVEEPLSEVQQAPAATTRAARHRSIVDTLRQLATLVQRYGQVLARDKWNLFILLAQAPIIGVLISLVVEKNDPRDFVYFILALVSIWFGTSLAARELVRERPIFERERMVNLGLFPYLGSKLVVLSLIVVIQTALLFGTAKVLHYAGFMYVPGVLFGIPHFLVMALTAIVGVTVGLFTSALVRTSEVATSLVPLILIPQILFAGLVTVPSGISKIIGATMPATWSFDELKRLSTLDTLKEEGADPDGPTGGQGLYQHTKDLNSKRFEQARNEIDDYSKNIAEILNRQPRERSTSANARPSTDAGGNVNPAPAPPQIPDPAEIDENLSRYVTFKHPWGDRIGNPVILFLMLVIFSVATLIALRIKDVR